jgi:hypothetical protein
MQKSPGFSRHGLLLSLLLCVCAASGAERGRLRTEREVKALFFVTLARYIDWPTNAFASESSPIVIGVLGADPFGGLLESLTDGEEVRGRPLKIARFATAENLKECHLLFLGEMTTLRQEVELARIGEKPIVTVSDRDGFTRKGGMVEMYLNPEKKVRLRISRGVVARSQVKISPALLRQADLVSSMEDFPHLLRRAGNVKLGMQESRFLTANLP